MNLNSFRASYLTPKSPKPKINFVFLSSKKSSFHTKNYTIIKNEKKEQKSKEKLILRNDRNDGKINIISVNNNNIPAPVTINGSKNKNNEDILSNNTKKLLNSKIVNRGKKLNSEIYNQNHDLSSMKKFPPNMPELLNPEHDINNTVKGIFSNATYGHLSKGIIPNIFFGHLMVDSVIKKKRYFRSSATQRNKSKLLTIIYVKPI